MHHRVYEQQKSVHESLEMLVPWTDELSYNFEQLYNYLKDKPPI